ncbi:unnamed protein product, partial [Clonostachys byssicola]
FLISSVLKWTKSALRRAPSPPLRFPSAGFEIVPASEPLEEEDLEQFSASAYYPVDIGDVVEKLGFGSTSTVWLAKNLQFVFDFVSDCVSALLNKNNSREHLHVALKIHIQGHTGKEEFEVSNKTLQGDSAHPGYHHLRTAREMIVLPHPNGDHHCMVQNPMWDSWIEFSAGTLHVASIYRCSKGAFSRFYAFSIIYTMNIKADDILHRIADKSILDTFVQEELTAPSARKTVKGVTLYKSRQFHLPKHLGIVVMSDLGAAVRGDLKRNHDAQPDVYRSPEVILEVPWSYPIDIWNVGVMIRDIFEGELLFHGVDSTDSAYSTRAHLAEVIGMLGMPPLDLIKRGSRSDEFSTDDGQWKADVPIPAHSSLGESEENLEGDEKQDFLRFMGGMLQWRPEDRKTAKELLQDPWLYS